MLAVSLLNVQVAHSGVTVAAVIHQPSHLVFGMFDDLLLLGKGGRTVYYGPQLGVQGYFESLGYELPSQVCTHVHIEFPTHSI